MSIVAAILAVGVIVGLFYLDREPGERTSPALWIPSIWLLIVASRPVSLWLHINREVSLADQYTEGSPVDAAIYGLLIVAAAFVLNRRWARVRVFLLANLPILLFFLYCALSVMRSDAPPIAAKRWIKAIGDFLMILVVLTDERPSLALKQIFTRVGFILLPLSAMFIVGFPSIGTTYDPVSHVTYYVGVTTFKNLLGITCMFAGLGSLWAFLSAYEDTAMADRKRHLIAHGFTVVMAIALIKRADSMTSLSAMGLASVVMVLSTRAWARRKPAAVFAMVSTAIGVALFALFLDTAGTLVKSLGRNATLTGRTQIWSAVLAQKVNPMIGTGFESFWMGDRMQNVWSLSQQGIEEAHNGYLELYLNLGWVGVALLGLLMVTGYRNAVLLFRNDAKAGCLRLSLFTMGVVYSLTEAGFRMLNPVWIGFLLALTAVPMLNVAPQAMPVAVHGKTTQRRTMKILR